MPAQLSTQIKSIISVLHKTIDLPFEKFQRHKTKAGKEHWKCSFCKHPEPKSTKHSVSASCVLLPLGTHTQNTHRQLQLKLLPPLHPKKAQSCSIPNWSLHPAPLRNRLLLENTGKTCSGTEHCKQGENAALEKDLIFFPRNCLLAGFRNNNWKHCLESRLWVVFFFFC